MDDERNDLIHAYAQTRQCGKEGSGVTLLQQAMLLCFVLFPLLLIVQALWIVWLFRFSQRGRAGRLHVSRQATQRLRAQASPMATAPTTIGVTTGSEATQLPEQGSEVSVV